MNLHYEGSGVQIWHGDSIEVLATLPGCSVDSVVCDPPYGLEFMGKDWDAFRPQRDARTAGRVGAGSVTGGASLKGDGGMTGSRVAYGGKRTMTRECAGCGIRDQFADDARHARRHPDCPGGGWVQVVANPDAPSPLLPFQQWCEEWARECLRVLKPGGHLLAFGGTRTWHRLACAVEDAGFEMRDSIAWLYGSGFPKSLDVSKAIDKAAGAEREVVGSKVGQPGYSLAVDKGRGVYNPDGRDSQVECDITAPATPDAERWQGWGTALKPAFEPVVVARKPLTGTVAQNVLTHGTGALNIDGCRIATDDFKGMTSESFASTKSGDNSWNRSDGGIFDAGRRGGWLNGPPAGRWPANVVLDEEMAAVLDEQSGYQRDGVVVSERKFAGWEKSGDLAPSGTTYGSGGGASRFFYVAKAPKRERPRTDDGTAHPTVKPLALMRWLVRLVTPAGGVVLEPFAGSGTTVEACILEGFDCIAIEREADYLPLIETRIERATA